MPSETVEQAPVTIQPSHQVNHAGISDQLSQAGFKNVDTVPALEQPPHLKGMGEDLLDIAGNAAHVAVETVTGKEVHSDTGTTANGPYRWLAEKYRAAKASLGKK